MEEAANPGQFDQKAYYEARGIGMVLKKAKLMIIEAKENFFFQKLYELLQLFFWAHAFGNDHRKRGSRASSGYAFR